MTDIVERLRGDTSWRNDNLLHEAADEIERLRERFDYAVKKNGEQWAEIERLQKRNALLEDLAVAAEWIEDDRWLNEGGHPDSDQWAVLKDALNKLREVGHD